jgi:hypothetical protein
MELGQAFTMAIESIVRKIRKADEVCIVISVDKNSNTCELESSGGQRKISKARLISIADDFEKKFVVYPKVGSFVSIAYLFGNSDKAIITKYSEVDEIVLNGSEFGGLVKADVLKAELDKTNEAITAIIAVINSAAPITEPGNGSPSALQAALKAAISGKKLGDYSKIQNEKVKHG